MTKSSIFFFIEENETGFPQVNCHLLDRNQLQGAHLPLGRSIIIKLELLHPDWKARRLITVH